MQIFVDANACPAALKDKLLGLAEGAGIPLTLLAGEHILERLADCDLLVTADSPLAAAAIGKGATVLNPGDSGMAPGRLTPLAQQHQAGIAVALDAWLTQRTGRSGHAPDQQ